MGEGRETGEIFVWPDATVPIVLGSRLCECILPFWGGNSWAFPSAGQPTMIPIIPGCWDDPGINHPLQPSLYNCSFSFPVRQPARNSDSLGTDLGHASVRGAVIPPHGWPLPLCLARRINRAASLATVDSYGRGRQGRARQADARTAGGSVHQLAGERIMGNSWAISWQLVGD